jgi:hypothetical protein
MYGRWLYAICRKPEEVTKAIASGVASVTLAGAKEAAAK